MRRLALLLTLSLSLLLPACQESSDDEGPGTDACSVLDLETRIINGTRCDSSNSPVVILTLLAKEGGIGICSGTLITQTDVLTAAHCFLTEELRSVTVRVNGRDVPVASWEIHPEVALPQNDVAIVRLAQPANARTVPLALSRAVEAGDIISVFGFGLDESGRPGALRAGEMEVTGVNSNNIVAVFEDEGSNVCNGDSGGPAVLTFKDGSGMTVSGIVGVTSFGTVQNCSRGDNSNFANTQSNAILGFITSRVPGVGSV